MTRGYAMRGKKLRICLYVSNNLILLTSSTLTAGISAFIVKVVEWERERNK